MKRTLNYTGRARILADYFHIAFLEDAKSASGHGIQITWDLTQLKLPSESSLILECEGQGQFYRFELGPCGDGLGEKSLKLGGVRDFSALRAEFFVTLAQGEILKIIAASAPVSIMLGEDTESAASSILPIRVDPTLNVMWRLDFGSGMPILDVSQRFGTVHTEPWFVPAVLPSVVREIYLSLVLDLHDLDDASTSDWRVFFANLGFEIDIKAEYSDSKSNDYILQMHQLADDVADSFSMQIPNIAVVAKDA